MPAIRSVADLYAHAIVLERDTAGHYRELSQRMKALGFEAVAELLEALADFEIDHLRSLERQSAGAALPAVSPAASSWKPAADLFTPRQVLTAALEAERRAYTFYETVVMTAADSAVREIARKLALEEMEHIALIGRLLEGPENRDIPYSASQKMGYVPIFPVSPSRPPKPS